MEAQWTLQELVAEVARRIAALPAPRNGQVRAIPDDRTVRYYGTIGLIDRPAAMRGRTALYSKKHLAQVVAIKRLQAMGRSLSEIQTLWPTLDDRTLARMSGVELDPRSRPAVRAGFWKREPGSQRAVGAGALATPDGDPASIAGALATPDGDPASIAGALATPDGDPASIAGALATPDGDTVWIAGAIATPDAGAPIAGAGVSAPAAAHGSPPAAVELRVELAPNVILSLAVVDETVAISPADVRALRAAAAPLVAELASRRLTPHLAGAGEEP